MFDFVIYLCTYGNTKDVTAQCLEGLHSHSTYKFEARWVSGDALIGRSRSRACSSFLWCDDSPFMIFVDGDIMFQPEDIEKLYRSMEAGYEVIGGGYAVADASYIPVKTLDVVTFGTNKVYEAKYVSTGFMGISRKALKQIRDALKLPKLHKGEWCECWPFFESGRLIAENMYISEDWDFCNKAKQAGVKCWFHSGALVGHCKERVIAAAEAINNMNQRLLPQVSMENVVQSAIVYDLSQYLNIPEPEVVTKMEMGAVEVAKEWEAKTSTEDFYKNSKAYLFDLANFNHQSAYWTDRVAPFKDMHDTNILDLGCGIGSTALFLSMNRNKVYGFDVNTENISFANFRKGKFGLDKVTFSTEPPVDYSGFDFVIAIDMLEHIEDLGSFLKDLGSKMKPEARLYHADAFKDNVHPMHFDHSQSVDRWLRVAGFIPLDARWAVKK